MDFGYTGARAAGIVRYRAPYNGEAMNFAIHEKRAEEEIAALAKQYPKLKSRFAEIAREEVNRKYHRVQDILFLMQMEVDRQMKAETLT